MQRFFRCVLGLFLFGAFILAPSVAHAADSCDAVIVDEAGILDDAQISAKAKELESLGATVRVRSFDTAPMGSLDAYREQQVRNCASWRGADGQPTGKLAVFTLTVTDHKSNVYTGADWANVMDSQVNRIRNQVMNPKLKAKQYTDGVLAAMTEVHLVITGEAPVGPPPKPADEGSGISRAAVMLILGIIGAVVVLVALIFGGLYWRRRVIERREAQADAQVAYDAAAEALSKIDTLRVQMVGVSVDKATMGLEEEATDRLKQLFKAANDLVTVALQANGTLSDDRSMTLDGKHSRVEYDTIANANSEVAAAANKAAKALDAVEVSCTETEQMIATMDSAAVILRDQATALIDRKAKLLADGYKVALDDQFAELDRNITAIFKFTEADTPGKALDERLTAEALVVTIDGQLAWLSKVRGDLQNRHQQLNERRLGLTANTKVAAETYQRLEDDYNRVLFEDAGQFVPDNKSMLKEAAQLLDAAAAAMSMEVQDWTRATDLLNEIDGLCEQGEQNCAAMSACERALAQLAVRTLSDADALSDKISQARQKVAGYKGSQYGYSSSLGDLTDDAVRLREQVRRHKPDYLSLAQECSVLESNIDSILSSARSEHNRVEAEERRQRERDAQAERDRQAAANAASYSSNAGGSYDGGSNSSGSY